MTENAIPDTAVKWPYCSQFDGYEDWAIVNPQKQNDTWIVCIHGHGSNGDQLYMRQDLREVWLPEFSKNGVRDFDAQSAK